MSEGLTPLAVLCFDRQARRADQNRERFYTGLRLGEVKCGVVRQARAPQPAAYDASCHVPDRERHGRLPTALRPKFPNGNLEERDVRKTM